MGGGSVHVVLRPGTWASFLPCDLHHSPKALCGRLSVCPHYLCHPPFLPPACALSPVLRQGSARPPSEPSLPSRAGLGVLAAPLRPHARPRLPPTDHRPFTFLRSVHPHHPPRTLFSSGAEPISVPSTRPRAWRRSCREAVQRLTRRTARRTTAVSLRPVPRGPATTASTCCVAGAALEPKT